MMNKCLVLLLIITSLNVLGSSDFCDQTNYITDCEEFMVVCIDDEMLRLHGSGARNVNLSNIIPECKHLYLDTEHWDYIQEGE